MKKFLKRVFLVILIILVLVQIPFIYRRYMLGKLSEKIAQLQSQRTTRDDPVFRDYKGVIHIHTSLGGHSTGTFDELIEGANANGLDFVVMTEHSSNLYDTATLTLNGKYGAGPTLFIGGNEMDTATDRFLLVPGGAEAGFFNKTDTREFLDKIHGENRLAFITYPEKHKTWDSNFDGIEVFSLNTAAKQINPLPVIFDAIWSYPAYPELTFAQYLKRPDANLQKFDEVSATRRISLFAGLDAHSNLGFHFMGDDASGRLLNLKFDRYKTIFRLFRIHVLLEKEKPLTREAVVEALGKGRYFTGFDVLGDTAGFMFAAEGGASRAVMGDEIAYAQGMKLKLAAPEAARFVVYRNGEKFAETADVTEASFEIAEKGTYRAEVYLDALGAPFDKMPWIMSNPIYVR
jgi:hypothetical protein